MPSVLSIKIATSSSEALKNASALPGEFERYFLNCTYCLTVYFLECNSLKIRSASASLDSYFPPTIDDNKSKTLSVGDFFNNGCRVRCFTAVNGASLLTIAVTNDSSLESSTEISSSIFLFVAPVEEIANCPVATLPANNVCKSLKSGKGFVLKRPALGWALMKSSQHFVEVGQD